MTLCHDELQRLTTTGANAYVDHYLIEAHMPPPLAARIIIPDASALL
jgi:hypothetical protein